jgi:hypothetical protein
MFADRFPEAELDFVRHTWLSHQHFQFPLPFREGLLFRQREFGLLNPFVYRLSRRHDPYPAIWDDFEYFADRWVDGRAGQLATILVGRIKAADAVVHNGENSLYRNSDPGMRALFLLWLAKTRYGKVTAEINHTAALANMTRPIMLGVAQNVLPKLDLVAVRESRSLQDLHQIGVDNAELYPDAVFYLGGGFSLPGEGVSELGKPDIAGDYFCFSASALPTSVPRKDWPGTVQQLIARIAQFPLRPVLVAKDDHCQYLREVASATGGIFFGPEHHFSHLWPLFRRARFLITGHYHYAIIASQVGCPFLPLTTNNHKMAGLAEQLKWPWRDPFDATALGPVSEQIVADARKIHMSRETYAVPLEKRARELTDETGQLIDRLRDIMKPQSFAGGSVLRRAVHE